MELPIPNEMIKQVHRLAKTTEKIQGHSVHQHAGQYHRRPNAPNRGLLKCNRRNTNNILEDKSTKQSGQDLDSTGSNECNKK